MRKYIYAISILAATSDALACEKCLKSYLEYNIADCDEVIDDLLDAGTEENIPYFFFAMGRRHAFEEVRFALDKECKADLHD